MKSSAMMMPGQTFHSFRTVLGWLCMLIGMLRCCGLTVAEDDVTVPSYTISHSVMTRGYDGQTCWVHARAGVLPADASRSMPTVVLTAQKLLLTGSDVFFALNSAESVDLGKSWSPLTEQTAFRRQEVAEGIEQTICDFTPSWHQASGVLLGTGHTVRYQNNAVMRVRPRATAYSTYDPEHRVWSSPRLLQMPDEPCFQNCGAGSVQRLDLADGSILLPVYFKEPGHEQYFVTVCRCRFDGSELTYVESGTRLTVPIKRGLYEPSITTCQGRYFLTLRNDHHGYVAVSQDGLNFDVPQRWVYDDGADLGNYNTQQHWVTHGDSLYLVYTRRGADNDHVFRHRAPLFMARVDLQSLRVVRESEQILIPQRGARLGNFGVVSISPNETWVIAAEWMQKAGPQIVIPVDNPLGADNSIHIAKIHWTAHGDDQ